MASLGIEPRSRAPETLILSIVLRSHKSEQNYIKEFTIKNRPDKLSERFGLNDIKILINSALYLPGT